MRKLTVLVIVLLTLGVGSKGFSQNLPYQQGLEPVSLTPDELFVLSNIPELKLPEQYKGPNAPLLPVSVDNSTQPFFRSITMQSGYECGQSSGIAFNFTYEIDRLRNLPASQITNQYPTHFTWDFLNNANNYQGASFFDSWEIVRTCGNMNVADYGGALNTGGYTRWISGYNFYYNGMQNRLNSVKAIRVDTPEGLQTLKYWLFDHLEGAAVGGVGNIYGQFFGTPATKFPTGTPEGGKCVQTFWGGSPSHGWTICGFNDSIRYDFNGDGQYTNNIDINGDGVVDMHDWEKGGVKFANGYSGTGWSDLGFCYTMYKNLADNIGLGGIWNHTVYVIDVKQTCSPQLTMKVTLKHTSRNKLKVTAGINTDLNATVPSSVLEFPIFKYQGADLYMQGGTTEADKTIEFGLDLAPLLIQVIPGQTIKYFLQVQENDPSGSATGEIVNWSLIDYTGGSPVTTNYPTSNVTIQNNTTTRLGINYALVFNKPSVVTNTLPPAQLYQPYSFNLSASGGTPPYLWDVKLNYPETPSSSPFPSVTAQQLVLTNNNSGYAIKTLDFSFPFYKKFVNKIYVYADGYILFDDQPYSWPYLIDKTLLFKQTSILSPFMSDLCIYPSNGQGVWFEGNANYAIIRWKTSVYNMQGNTNLNFAVKLFPNGTIEYYYGDMTFPPGISWTGGLSSGDNKNFQYSSLNNGASIPSNTLDKFTTCGFPPEMEISEDGHFTGTPTYAYQNLPIKFMVTDNNNISNVKTLTFSTFGLLISQSIISGTDSIIEFGETAKMSLIVTNIGGTALHNIHFSISTADPYITLIDSTEDILVISGNQTITLNNAFTFLISPSIPDNHAFQITLHVRSQEREFLRELNFVAHAPVFHVTQTMLIDGDNGFLDPGENADLLVTYKNKGSAKASSINLQLATPDTNIIVNTNTAAIDQLDPDSSKTVSFNVTGGVAAPLEHLYKIVSTLSANNNYNKVDTIYLFSGNIIEDFETGNFNKFPWFNTGQWPWIIESGVKYEGNFSARSGVITDNAESIFNLTATVLKDGEISFWKLVSCEQDPSGNKNYDYLEFNIDGFEMGRWDGISTWSQATYPVSAGYHTFSWIYHKDDSSIGGWDGCLLDFIALPLIEGAIPQLSPSPYSFEKRLDQNVVYNDSLILTNIGGGKLKYAVMVFDTVVVKNDKQFDNLSGSFMTCGTETFIPGQAFNWNFTVHNQSTDNEYIKQIKLDFPPGVEITGATNFSGGSLGELIFNGTTGNGASMLWQGVSANGRGVIKPGETAQSAITGNVQKVFPRDVFVIYDIRGDSTGMPMQQEPGMVKISNQGLSNSWLTLSNATGSLLHGQSGTVNLSMNTAGLSPQTYRCNMIARDYYNNTITIPVTLHVNYPVSINEENKISETRLLSNYPNPFKQETIINLQLSKAQVVNLEIVTINGTPVRSWSLPLQPPGIYQVKWDGKNDNGQQVAGGVYVCRMKSGDYQGTLKIVRIP
ncbi:MAG: FlgD immunoglobulin-like domain containing protein [Bacteroidales bacterium]|nr:hypothetical protein [Bacteroidales bacterium]MDD4603499.1 FlgD immunoglobulin-like domain containing protein [Bacteroidales bacterium]